MPRPPLPINTTGEIRAYKAGDKWIAIADHRDGDGRKRQYQRSGPSKSAAIARLKTYLAQPRTQGEINSRTRMNTLAAQYFTRLEADVSREVCSPSTLRLYQGVWDKHGAPRLGLLALTEADVQVLDQFLLNLREKSPAIAKTMRGVLSGMMGIAARYKAIPTNPVRDVSRLRGAPTTPVRALEPAEAMDLWCKLVALSKMPGEHVQRQNRTYTPTRIHPDIPDIVLWMLGTSQRIGQTVALCWAWIDMEAEAARVGPNIIRVKGEGLKLNQGTSKTKPQVITIPSQVMVMLRDRRQRPYCDPLGPVFPASDSSVSQWRDLHNTLGDLRRALDMADYEWVTSHTFRRTVATILDDAGLSAREIADVLTHSRPSMTQDRYMARKVRNPRAVAAIEAMLATTPQRLVVELEGR